MLRTAVESSNVKEVAWENETLTVTFKRGHAYNYYEVPLDVYNELVSSESVGKFLRAVIEPNYRYEPVPPELGASVASTRVEIVAQH